MDVDFSEFFKAPPDYNPPKNTDLEGSTQFPNLNSIEFRSRQSNKMKTDGLMDFYEILEANEDQSTILLATNSYNQRLWKGAVLGYDKFSDIGKQDAEVIKLHFDSNITSMHFVDKTIVLFTTASGSIQLWSTQCEIRQKNGYNFFQVAKKSEHIGMVTGFSMLGGNKNKALTGSSDGCLKVWKVEPCDLVSEKTFQYAHKEVITDISAKPQSNDLFATCSRDRFLSIWDLRSRLPLINSCTSEFPNTACLWSKCDGVEKLYLGDDSGALHIYDPRKLDVCLATQNILDRPIYKLKLNPVNKLIGVLGQTNTFKLIDTTHKMGTVYAEPNAIDFVRDICWVNIKDRPQHSFFSVGWSKLVKHHSIKQSTN